MQLFTVAYFVHSWNGNNFDAPLVISFLHFFSVTHLPIFCSILNAATLLQSECHKPASSGTLNTQQVLLIHGPLLPRSVHSAMDIYEQVLDMSAAA